MAILEDGDDDGDGMTDADRQSVPMSNRLWLLWSRSTGLNYLCGTRSAVVVVVAKVTRTQTAHRRGNRMDLEDEGRGADSGECRRYMQNKEYQPATTVYASTQIVTGGSNSHVLFRRVSGQYDEAVLTRPWDWNAVWHSNDYGKAHARLGLALLGNHRQAMKRVHGVAWHEPDSSKNYLERQQAIELRERLLE
jgi:hypothetical protein